MLGGAKESKEPENRPVSVQPTTAPPSPTSSSIYLIDLNASSNDVGLQDANYNPYYDHSMSDLASLSNKKASLSRVRRSFAKQEKRTLVVGRVKENDDRTRDAVRRWCEVNVFSLSLVLFCIDSSSAVFWRDPYYVS
jgi:hypothetical protein